MAKMPNICQLQSTLSKITMIIFYDNVDGDNGGDDEDEDGDNTSVITARIGIMTPRRGKTNCMGPMYVVVSMVLQVPSSTHLDMAK